MVSVPHGGQLAFIKQVSESDSSFSEDQKLLVSSEIKVALRNLANGILSPLQGFMNQEDYLRVINDMRLAGGVPWTMPLLLHIPENYTAKGEILLVDENDAPLGILDSRF